MGAASRSDMSRQVRLKAFTTYKFGDYSFRLDRGLLLGGTSVALPPKETELLQLLLARNGAILPYDTIEAELWPDEEISYSSMARLVHSLRAALGGGRNAFIATVPKRGYRMNVPVHEVTDTDVSNTIAQSVETDTTTYAHFLEGKREANRGSYAGQARAAKLLEQALDRDAGYTAAAVALAEVRMYQSLRGYLVPEEALRLGLDACRTALDIEPEQVGARCVAAWFDGIINRNPGRALLELDRALDSDHQYAHGHICRSYVLRALGRVDEGLDDARRAYEFDPYWILSAHAYAWSLFCAGRVAEALDLEIELAAELPKLDIAQAYRAIFAASLFEHDEAERACTALLTSHADNPGMMCAVAYAWARRGEIRDALSLAQTLESASEPRAPRTQLASVYAGAGDEERALDLLREAKAEYCPWCPVAHVDQRFCDMMEAPGFQSLFSSMRSSQVADVELK